MSVAEEVDVDAVVARASQGLNPECERIPRDPATTFSVYMSAGFQSTFVFSDRKCVFG